METKEESGEMRIRLVAVLLELALIVAPPPSRHILDPKTNGAVVTE
jgi:hypothetical protein